MLLSLSSSSVLGCAVVGVFVFVFGLVAVLSGDPSGDETR